MNDRYYAIATKYAKIEYNLTTGQKYILETSQKSCGTVEVYDLEGNFLKTAQLDDFENYIRID